jgi:Matrixin
MGYKLSLLVAPTVVFLLIAFNFSAGLATNYYSEQTDFRETFVPMTGHIWDQHDIESCIYIEDGVDDAYYVWTKLSVQKWRQALQDYTGNQQGWNITARFVKFQAELESCDIKVYIYGKYSHFPDFPAQTGAYTSVKFRDGNDYNNNDDNNSSKNLDVRIYLSPVVLHGDGKNEIKLPSYAFRNSAVHELGHALGLGHMQSQKGYLMSPQFDFWEESEQLPITTLELDALVKAYGTDGFG